MYNSQKQALIDAAIEREKNNTELHIPGYNYCGPGTRVVTRIMRGDKGINELDSYCQIHDVEYMLHAGDAKALQHSDTKVKEHAAKLRGISAWLVNKVFAAKRVMEELNFMDPVKFATGLASSAQDIQRQLGEMMMSEITKTNSYINNYK